jgi:hypothetical protein
MKYFILALFCSIFLSCQKKAGEQKDDIIEESITDHPTKEINTAEEYCYLKVNGKDSIKLNFKKQGDSIWGIYHNLPYGIDKRISSFKGVMQNNRATAVSTYSAEGMDYMEEIQFTTGDNEARLNYGQTEQGKDGVWRLKNNAPLQEYVLPKVQCN